MTMTNDLVTEARKGGPCAELGDRCRAIEAASGCFCAAVADRIEQLQTQNLRLSGMCYDLTAERNKAVLGNHRFSNEPTWAELTSDWKARAEALTADFALQVQRTDEQREAYEQALSVMEADNARLREALEPFAAKASGYDGIPPAKYWGDISCVLRHYDDEEVSVTVGNIRKARAALTGKEPSHE